MIRAIHTKPVKDQVYEVIRERIVKLVIKPGQAVSEKELSDLLQVSRTPVREAFIRLAADDLVRVLPQRGTFVSKISLPAIRESCFIREAIEVAVALKAAAIAGEPGVDRLRQIIAEQVQYGKMEDYDGFYSCDERFHQMLGQLSGFPASWDVVRAVKLHMDRARYLSLPIESRVRTIVEQHELIVNAIEAGDAGAVERHTRNHIQETLSHIEKLSGAYPEYFELEG